MSGAVASVTTRVGRARWDDHRYFGHGALTELLGGESFLGLTMIAATGGRRPTAEERALLDTLAVSMGAADPRIWPLKITRLVAAYGGTIAGYVAGQLCTECDAIGPWVTGPAAELLVSVREAVADDRATDETFERAVRAWLEAHRRLSGYGVAFRADDERFVALRAHVQRAGRAELTFWALQERLSALLVRDRGLKPNIAMGAAALLLDMGLSPAAAQLITNLANANTFYANALEGAQQRAEVLRDVGAGSVRYVGRSPREVPAAR